MDTLTQTPGARSALRVAVVTETYPPEINGVARTVGLMVEALCDRVLILHRGQKMAFGSLEEIRGLATLHSEASLEDVFFAVTERRDSSNELAGIS